MLKLNVWSIAVMEPKRHLTLLRCLNKNVLETIGVEQSVETFKLFASRLLQNP